MTTSELYSRTTSLQLALEAAKQSLWLARNMAGDSLVSPEAKRLQTLLSSVVDEQTRAEARRLELQHLLEGGL